MSATLIIDTDHYAIYQENGIYEVHLKYCGALYYESKNLNECLNKMNDYFIKGYHLDKSHNIELTEYIICAAAKNPDDGRIILSRRHHDKMFVDTVNCIYGELKSHTHFIQGFYTNKNRFVDRLEAYEIADERNQIRRLSPSNSKKLFSEMLY